MAKYVIWCSEFCLFNSKLKALKKDKYKKRGLKKYK